MWPWKSRGGITVKGDSTLLRVLLENLLGNAWKFTAKRSRGIIKFGTTSSKWKMEDRYGVRQN